MSEKCDCQICERHRAFLQNLRHVPDDRRAFFNDLYDQLNNAEMNSEYYKAIVEGTWPDADRLIHQVRKGTAGAGG